MKTKGMAQIGSIGPGLALLILIGPPFAWTYLRAARWRGMTQHGDELIFPTSTLLQVSGMFVVYVMGFFILYSISQKHWETPQIFVVTIVFFLAGISVLFREIRVTPKGIFKSFFWYGRGISWSDAESMGRSKAGSWVLVGDCHSFVIDRNYCDLGLLINEISSRMPIAPQEMELRNGQTRSSYEDSFRRLQSAGDLEPGSTIPALTDHLPEYHDTETSGISFFRKRLRRNTSFEDLTLPMTYIAQSELLNVNFRNVDLTESSLCWNDFFRVDFQHASLVRADLRSSCFRAVSFARADLREADCRHSTFAHCVFTGALMGEMVLTRGQGSEIRLSNEQHSQIDWRIDAGEEPPGG